jgi:energy-coupling factor transporter ATP-binding protein EcfA2
MSLVCYDCASPVEDGALLCPVCGGGTLTRDRARPTRTTAEQGAELPAPWSVMARWDVGGVVSVAGPPGAGKSTLAALLQPVLWLTCEQTPGQAAAMLRRVARGDELPEIVQFPGGRPDVVGRELAGVGRGLVVLDSLTAAAQLDDQVGLLHDVLRWARAGDRRALVILGVTSDDTPAGRRQLRHAVDVSATIHAGDDGLRVLQLEKNRFGPLRSSYFGLDESGAVQPAFPYSYSVEGRPGAYRLHPYPTEGARWDGGLRARFGLKPEPGWASATRVVEGYPGGRMAPADAGERRAFAEQHGLRWLDGGEV